MYRTHSCGELRSSSCGQTVTLAGWVQKVRALGAMTFIDIRDRYGITQLVIEESASENVKKMASSVGREAVIQVTGEVVERSSKNAKIETGDIEVIVSEFKVLNYSETPPFTIEDHSDGGDELRMKYRYLDLRRNPLKEAMILRHKMAQEIRNFLSDQGFLEIETPYLIKSTPEGARDFIVPSRMNQGEFYALPQSPQTFKQLLMVAGYDRYFQIVRCFRDEDLRADRQPEFTQIDCEMAFVERDDILGTFEALAKSMFKKIKGIEFEGDFQRMDFAYAMEKYGCDKPDIRFEMLINDITVEAQSKYFELFNASEYVGGIVCKGCADYTRKQLDELTNFVKRPQVGAKGLIYIKYNADNTIKSSIDKFFTPEDLQAIAAKCGAEAGDLMLILPGEKRKVLAQLCTLRLEMGSRLGLRDNSVYAPLWVVDFPLLEWDEETARFYAMHHPFTSPKLEDMELFSTDPGKVRANAYDFIINGVEVGGGSIRIHDSNIQNQMFGVLGFSKEEAEEQFGFLLNAFKYGAPPHGGIAFGFDRWCSLFGGTESIRDYIAFPKNNSGRDIMIDSPSTVAEAQLDELSIQLKSEE
ncbi:MAG: aspartate--tRNA ligase [Rikenellaceae bacterium]